MSDTYQLSQLMYTNTRSVSDYSEFTLDELTAMSIWQRIQIRNWNLELITITFIFAFVAIYKLGDLYNASKATKFLNGITPVLSKNFYQVGVNSKQLYIKDSAENYSSYASGRTNIAKVDIKLVLQPRQNLFVWILEYLLGFFTDSVRIPTDKAEIIITPSITYDNFVVAIVSKLGMNDARKFNYFLSLCKTSDSTNLPQSFVYMSEANEFQEKFTTQELSRALTLGSADFIKFVAVTDQPVERPETFRELIPQRRLVLSVDISTKKEDLETVGQVLEALFSFVDKIADKKITFRPESLKKVVKTREVEVDKLKKIQEEIQQEKLADEKAQQKREERDRLRNLSREEQIKLEKKEQEKSKKKMQRKQRIKM
ncbi:endoplasmic reticulum membrane protein [Spathaspora sp. JA1]|nr:endoplasmic reticulum membrane protein [Spathaspora sp. JA1]